MYCTGFATMTFQTDTFTIGVCSSNLSADVCIIFTKIDAFNKRIYSGIVTTTVYNTHV